MISTRHRFHGQRGLRFVFAKGQTVHGKLWTIRYLLNERRKSYRLSVVVSKKVHKSAVVRNRIRRRLYEIIRGHEAEISQPIDMAVIVRGEQVATMPTEELASSIISQLRQARIISK